MLLRHSLTLGLQRTSGLRELHLWQLVLAPQDQDHPDGTNLWSPINNRKPLSRKSERSSAGPVTLQVGLLYQEDITFLVLEELTADVVFGRPWLMKHDPILSWATAEVLKWGKACSPNLFPHTANKTPSLETAIYLYWKPSGKTTSVPWVWIY